LTRFSLRLYRALFALVLDLNVQKLLLLLRRGSTWNSSSRLLGHFLLDYGHHFHANRVLFPAFVVCEGIQYAFIAPLLFNVASTALLLLKRERRVGLYVLILLDRRVVLQQNVKTAQYALSLTNDFVSSIDCPLYVEGVGR